MRTRGRSGYSTIRSSLLNRLGENAEKIAAKAGIKIEFIGEQKAQKENRMKKILAQRGERTRMVCIFFGLESNPCSTYKPWHNKQAGKKNWRINSPMAKRCIQPDRGLAKQIDARLDSNL